MSALVVGGMVGGGIYVALGVVVEAAGSWAWLSFAIAGVAVVGLFLVYRLATTKPIPLAVIVALMLASYFLRPWILRRAPVENEGGLRLDP